MIFSRGAVRASLKALREGYNIGILIDQNTKVREGGVFVNFFGLPVPCSQTPATFQRVCAQEGVKVRILVGASMREPDGSLLAQSQFLSKPESEYDPAEMIQELMSITEEFIRKYPEQYIWMYKRFAHIPRDLDEETEKKFPFYARKVKTSFYSRVKKVKTADYLPDNAGGKSK